MGAAATGDVVRPRRTAPGSPVRCFPPSSAATVRRRSASGRNIRAALFLLLGGLLRVGPAAASPAEDLAALCSGYWEGHLRANPTTATSLGDRRFDDRLRDITPEGRAADSARLEAVIARARQIDPAALPAADRITRGMLIETVGSDLAVLSCALEEWVVSPLRGPQVGLLSISDYTVIETREDVERFLARCRAMGPYMDAHIANLRRGLAGGRTDGVDAVRKTIEQLDVLAGMDADRWSPAVKLGEVAFLDTDPDGPALRGALDEIIATIVRPAFLRYRDCLRTEILPAARPQDRAGLMNLPGGDECYRKQVLRHTSLDMSPEEIHRLGLEQVARFRKNLSELGRKVFGTGDVAAIQKRLREDPAMHFSTPDEVEEKARESLDRARAAMSGWFGVLPKAECVVRRMSDLEAPQSTIAYYRQPAADGSRPGMYMINTWKPETRPRYEAEVLAFHEAIPGHHLQIAIAQELTGLPEFRKHDGVTAYIEGWALYTESLCDEMGLYSGDVDRIGMLSFDAWRSCRLVVDTGLHAMGWTRQQAIDYMIDNSVLAENNIVNEVDRYLTNPGQALAYKLGQLEILKLREEGRRRLGDRFDIKAFHDVVLENGAVALPVLRECVEAYYDRVDGGGAAR